MWLRRTATTRIRRASPPSTRATSPPPDAPLESEGTDKAKTTTEPAPQPAPAATPAPAPAPEGDEQTNRPRTLEPNSWRRQARQGDRTDEATRWFKPEHVHVEIRFGPYSPNIDDDPAAGGAYQKFFGSDAKFYFGLELDWLPLYIPYVASLGGGFGWGFVTTSAPTKIQGTDADAGSETSLTIFPMYAAGVVRIDGPLRELFIPIVPYGKIGFGFAPWSVGGPNADTSEVDPSGMSTGLHVALGGAIALNAFDRASA